MSDGAAAKLDHAGWILFRNRDFLFYTIGRFFSALAYQIEVVAVGWLVYELTHDAFALGLVGLTSFLPAISLALVTGHVADRFERRTLLTFCYGGMTLLALGFLVWVWSGSEKVWPIYLLIFGIGICRAFAGPAGQALVPNLVPRAQFSQAIAWNSSVFQTATIIGPALGGILYAFGRTAVFGTAATCLFLAVLAFMAIRPRPLARTTETASWERLIAGVHFIRGKPIVFGAISLDLFAVLLGGATALLPIYARDILETGPWGLGLMRSMPAAGAVMTALILAHRPLTRHAGRRMFQAVALFGLATIGFGLSKSLYLSLGCLFVLGAADMISVIIRQTLVQLETPDAMRGRVAAVNSVFIGASNELGEFESGTLAAFLGAVPAVVIGGVGTLAVAVLWARWFPALRARDRLIE